MTRTSFMQRLAAVAAGDESVDEFRLRRTLLFMLAAFSSVAGLAWGGLYLAFGEGGAAAYPLAYSAVSIPTLVFGRSIHRLDVLIRLQLALITFVPFLLAIALGGYAGSSAVVLWSLLGPIGAFLIGGRSGAARWLAVYLLLLVVVGVWAPTTRVPNQLPDGVIVTFYILNVGAVSSIAFGLLYYFVGENRRVLELLRLEKDKSERLLLNILPREVADLLRDEEQTIAEQYDAVSILFADIVDFTPLSESMPPAGVVGLLNLIYSHFDRLVIRHGVEKVRTIGDNYMVVAGAPRRRPDHARALASMALDMMEFVDDLPPVGEMPVRFRIGINTGPVVAGVIGTTKFQYDLWGDAVNVASRLESHGEPGRIQVGRATMEALGEEFVCRPRGTVEVKGKGAIQTWWLLGKAT